MKILLDIYRKVRYDVVMMKHYNVTIVRVRRNTGPVGGPWLCERGSWQRDTLREKRDRFRVEETIKVGTEQECRQAAEVAQ